MSKSLFFVFALLCSTASADFITSFRAYIHTGNQSQVAVQNTSDAEMVEFRIDWSPAASLGEPGKLLSPGLYGLETEVTGGGLASHLSSTSSGRTLTFTFDGMRGWDGFGRKTPVGGVSGGLIDGTTLTATFESGGEYKSLQYVFSGTPGSGVSYNVSASSVPEPGSLGILAAVFSVFSLVRFRKS